MYNALPNLNDRALTVKHEVSSYTKSTGGNDSFSYEIGDIGAADQAFSYGKKKKDLETDSGLLAAMLAKIFGGSAAENSTSLKHLTVVSEKTQNSYEQLPAYSDDSPPKYSFDDSDSPPAYSAVQTTSESKPAAEVKQEAPPPAPMASEKEGKPVEGETRPAGDTRSAEQIINDNPALKNLGDQKDIQRGKLKDICGDWTDANKDPKSRADAAWKMAHVLNWIDNSKTAHGKDIKAAGNGDITGITDDGDARHGTEAGLLKDFGDKGYAAIKDDQRLDTTKDTHVREDGTNKDNFQWFCGEAGKVLKYIFPALGNVLEGIGESRGGFWGAVKGGLSGLAETVKNCAVGLKDALLKGKISPVQIVASMYKANVTDALKDDGKEKVGEVLDKLPI